MPLSREGETRAPRRTIEDVQTVFAGQQLRDGRVGTLKTLTLIAVVGTTLVGCASTYSLDLMPAPSVFSDGTVDPFPGRDPLETVPYAGILYATDRAPSRGGDDGASYYSDERGYVVRLGLARVELGDGNLTWDEVRRISALQHRDTTYPLTVRSAEEFGVLDDSLTVFDDSAELAPLGHEPAARFARLVNEQLAGSTRKHIYIYVHGFKMVFENPLIVASEFWHYLGYDGVMVAYSWPSTPSLLAYFSDIEDTSLSARNLHLLIQYLARETDAERIHILGYSAGTRLVLAALDRLALERAAKDRESTRAELRLGHVVLIGSDADPDVFGSYLADGILDLMEDLTLYSSETDEALGTSRWLFDRARLGQSVNDIELSEEVVAYLRRTRELAFVDVTDTPGSSLRRGHGYLRLSPWVSSDILTLLRHDLTPPERGLVRQPDGALWTFPPDYIRKLRRTVRQLSPTSEVRGATD